MMLRSSRSRQSGVSLILFALFGLILLIFAGLLIGLDGYYSAIQRLDAASESGALAAAQDLCQPKYNAAPRVYSIDRNQAINDVAALLDKNMGNAISYPNQSTSVSDCTSQNPLGAYTCPTLPPGPIGAVVYCMDFPADSTSGPGSVTLHLLWIVQQPFAGIVGPSTLHVTSAQVALSRINNPAPPASLSGYEATVLADTPQAYWRLNDATCLDGSTATDRTTHGNNATYHNHTNNSIACNTATTDINSNTSLNGATNTPNTNIDETFNHSDLSYLSTTFSSGYSTTLGGDGARTVELWFADSVSTGHNVLFEGGTLSGEQAMQISVQYAGQLASSGDVSGSGILVEFSDGATTSTHADEVFIPTAAATDGAWHMLDVTLSGTSVVVYVDGVAAANGFVNTPNTYIASSDASCGGRSCTLPLTPNTTKASGGVQFGGGDSYGFDGLLDEVAVYGTALAPHLIGTHYAAAFG